MREHMPSLLDADPRQASPGAAEAATPPAAQQRAA